MTDPETCEADAHLSGLAELTLPPEREGDWGGPDWHGWETLLKGIRRVQEEHKADHALIADLRKRLFRVQADLDAQDDNAKWLKKERDQAREENEELWRMFNPIRTAAYDLEAAIKARRVLESKGEGK